MRSSGPAETENKQTMEIGEFVVNVYRKNSNGYRDPRAQVPKLWDGRTMAAEKSRVRMGSVYMSRIYPILTDEVKAPSTGWKELSVLSCSGAQIIGESCKTYFRGVKIL